MGFRIFVFPEEDWAAQAAENIIEGTDWEAGALNGARIGFAHTAANMYRESDYKQKATEILVRLIPLAGGELAKAVSDVFRLMRDGPVDECGLSLIKALVAAPEALRDASKTFLLDYMDKALSTSPELILETCEVLVDQCGGEMQDRRTRLSSHAGELVDMAITLQRYQALRSRATVLFERLHELDLYGVQETLHELDRHPRRANMVRRRRRRRRSG